MKKRIGRYVMTGLILALVLAGLFLIFPNQTVQALVPNSFFVENNLVTLAIISFGTPLLAASAYLYELVDLRLPGSRTFKTWYFIAALLSIWFPYITEPLPFIDPFDQFLAMIRILIVACLMATLLASWVAMERLSYRPKVLMYTKGLLIFGLFFFMGRFISHSVFKLYPANVSNFTSGQALWSLFMGISCGFSFMLLQKFIRRQKNNEKAILFGLVFFGVACITIESLHLVYWAVPFGQWLLRCGVDILAVYLASVVVINMQEKELTYVN